MPSRNAVIEAIAMLAVAAYPNQPGEEQAPMLITLWCDILGPLDDSQLRTATRAYMQSPDKDDRWWPTPGRLLALSGHGEALKFLGSDADADRAWIDYERRMRATDGIGGPQRGTPLREFDTTDTYRNDAMWAGHEAIGGWRAWARMESDDKRLPAVWRKAYKNHRGIQRLDGDAVAQTAKALTAAPRPALTVVK